MLLNVEEIELGPEECSREQVVWSSWSCLTQLQHGWEWTARLRSPVLGDFFFFFLHLLALSLMQILKSLVTMETISWAARQGAAVRDLYALVSACVLYTCLYVLMYICGGGGEELILWINPSVTSRVWIIGVQILVQSFTSMACSCLPLFAFAICCDRQLGTLFCLIMIPVHSYYSVTRWRQLCSNRPLSHLTVNVNTMRCIDSSKCCTFPFCHLIWPLWPAWKSSFPESFAINVSFFFFLRLLS